MLVPIIYNYTTLFYYEATCLLSSNSHRTRHLWWHKYATSAGFSHKVGLEDRVKVHCRSFWHIIHTWKQTDRKIVPLPS